MTYKIFRQEVEEIESSLGCTHTLCKTYYSNYRWDCKQCRIDRICAAVERCFADKIEYLKDPHSCYTLSYSDYVVELEKRLKESL